MSRARSRLLTIGGAAHSGSADWKTAVPNSCRASYSTNIILTTLISARVTRNTAIACAPSAVASFNNFPASKCGCGLGTTRAPQDENPSHMSCKIWFEGMVGLHVGCDSCLLHGKRSHRPRRKSTSGRRILLWVGLGSPKCQPAMHASPRRPGNEGCEMDRDARSQFRILNCIPRRLQGAQLLTFDECRSTPVPPAGCGWRVQAVSRSKRKGQLRRGIANSIAALVHTGVVHAVKSLSPVHKEPVQRMSCRCVMRPGNCSGPAACCS